MHQFHYTMTCYRLSRVRDGKFVRVRVCVCVGGGYTKGTYDALKRDAFSLDLKMERVSTSQMETGRLFHRTRA